MKEAISLAIHDKELTIDKISLDAVRLENGKPQKLTAKGLTKSLTYSHPLSNTIYTAVNKDKGSFAPVNLEDLLQLNSPKDIYLKKKDLLQFTAPPKSGYNPIVYMQSTNPHLSQSQYKNIYLKILHSLEEDVVDNDLTKIPSISNMDLENSPNKDLFYDLEGELDVISDDLSRIYQQHPSLVNNNIFNNILHEAKVILTNRISMESVVIDPRAILLSRYLNEIYLVNVNLGLNLDNRTTKELEAALLALQNILEHVKS